MQPNTSQHDPAAQPRGYLPEVDFHRPPGIPPGESPNVFDEIRDCLPTLEAEIVERMYLLAIDTPAWTAAGRQADLRVVIYTNRRALSGQDHPAEACRRHCHLAGGGRCLLIGFPANAPAGDTFRVDVCAASEGGTAHEE